MTPIVRTRLIEARQQRHWSQQEVADLLATTQNNVSRWERGITTPNPYFRAKLCELFSKSAMELGLAKESPSLTISKRETLEAAPTSASLATEFTLWTVPYPRNPYFTGREALLDELHTRLHGSQTIALSRSHALHGLGGIGKTQLAIEYAYRHAQDYAAVFWITAETPESILASLQHVAATLALPPEQDQTKLVTSVGCWLSTHRDWLLIWDNVEDLDLLSQFLPPTRAGAVLLTTRRQALGTFARGLELAVLEPEEGMLLLLRRAKLFAPNASSLHLHQLAQQQPVEFAAAEEIVQRLDGLPLALDQAGAYLEETGCCLSDYLRTYQQQQRQLLAQRGISPTAHPYSVMTTFHQAFGQLAQQDPIASDLLRVCAFLVSDAIPKEFFVGGAAHLGSRLASLATDPTQLDLALASLRSLSLVNLQPGTQTFSLHSLVQAVFRDEIPSTEHELWQERVLLALEATFPASSATTSSATWSQCERLLAHALWSLQHAGAAVQTPEGATLSCKVAQYLQVRGRYQEAQSLLWRALSIRERCLGTEHPEVANVLNELAYVSYKQGVYDQAEALHLQAVALLERVLGCAHPDLVRALNDLAVLYSTQEKYSQAEALQRRAMQLDKHQHGPEHPTVANSLGNLALLARRQGHFGEAEDLYLKALHIFEQHLGEEHPRVGLALNNLADLYLAQEKLAQAEPLLQRALRLSEQSLGAEHPDVAYPLANLADLYLAQGQYTKVAPLYQRARSIWEQALGETHPNVAYALHGLATLSLRQGRVQEAQALYQRALALREHALGPDHRETVETRTKYTELLRAMGREEEAASIEIAPAE